jgi:ABC-type antimicrobial peptide transport system permease subunit
MASAPRAERRFGAFGRLKPGVTLAQARAEMDAIQERLAAQYPESNANVGASLTPLAGLLSSMRPAFVMLATAVAFLLTIACANVAGLLLARGAARQKEIAVRAALGASRGRIVTQALGESLVLAVAGGVVGLGLAAVSLRLLRNALPDVIPRLREMTVDWTVLAFTAGASLLTGVLSASCRPSAWRARVSPRCSTTGPVKAPPQEAASAPAASFSWAKSRSRSCCLPAPAC